MKALTVLATSAAMVMLSVVLAPSPASGTTHSIKGTLGYHTRCFHTSQIDYYDACLYYDGFSSSLYGLRRSDPDLAGATFSGGNGDGAGHYVKNNANAIECTPWVGYYCYSYYNENYTGDNDVIGENFYGYLYLTWNDEASIWIQN